MREAEQINVELNNLVNSDENDIYKLVTLKKLLKRAKVTGNSNLVFFIENELEMLQRKLLR
jgi:hypothetical protein